MLSPCLAVVAGHMSFSLSFSGVMPLPEVLRVGEQIAQGLEQLHAAKVLALDLKPGG
jgi:serine/threonine protein kinase